MYLEISVKMKYNESDRQTNNDKHIGTLLYIFKKQNIIFKTKKMCYMYILIISIFDFNTLAF